jgi:hypothetical protein
MCSIMQNPMYQVCENPPKFLQPDVIRVVILLPYIANITNGNQSNSFSSYFLLRLIDFPTVPAFVFPVGPPGAFRVPD